MKRRCKKWVTPIGLILMVPAFQLVFLWLQNAEEVAFSETLSSFATVGIFSLISFAICYGIVRKANQAAIITALFVIVVTNYTFLDQGLKLLFPSLRYWHTILIVLLVEAHVAYLIWRFMPEEVSRDLVSVLCVVCGGLILFNVITGLPGIVNRVKAHQQLEKTQIDERQFDDSLDLPNIYLLLFDEFAGFRQMEGYFGYDNVQLKNFLEENHFNVSYTTHNESIWTKTVMTNLVNLDYVTTDDTSPIQQELIRKEGRMFQMLRDCGYSVGGVNAGFFGLSSYLDNVEEEATGATTITGEGFKDICLKRSIIYPFLQIFLVTDVNIEDIIKPVLCLSSAEKLPDRNTFILGYFGFTHQPYRIDENEEPIPTEQSNNWDYYVTAYKYATKAMIQMAGNIIENDPKAIIIIQSDHGVRVNEDGQYQCSLDYMSNPFNAVYLQGRELDIEGLSSVNTLRMVLNDVLGTHYDVLPVPAIDMEVGGQDEE